jgi:hypothetical protein
MLALLAYQPVSFKEAIPMKVARTALVAVLALVAAMMLASPVLGETHHPATSGSSATLSEPWTPTEPDFASIPTAVVVHGDSGVDWTVFAFGIGSGVAAVLVAGGVSYLVRHPLGEQRPVATH